MRVIKVPRHGKSRRRLAVFTIMAVARALIGWGVNIYIFAFCPTNLF